MFSFFSISTIHCCLFLLFKVVAASAAKVVEEGTPCQSTISDDNDRSRNSETQTKINTEKDLQIQKGRPHFSHSNV